MKFRSLFDKLKDQDYIEGLSDRRRREIMICKELLTEEELRYYSSIDVAYHVARERYIKKNYDMELLKKIRRQRYPVRELSKLIS